MKKIITSFCLVVFTLLTLCGCGSDSIVGTWKSELAGATYTFNKDGTGEQYSDFAEGNSFKYTTKGDVLTITESQFGLEIVQEYNYKIEDGCLKLAVKTDSNEKYYTIFMKTDGSGDTSNNDTKTTDSDNADTKVDAEESDKDLLIGEWDGQGYSYDFRDDGTGYTYGANGYITSIFTYEVENGHIYITESYSGVESTEDYVYQLEEDTLKIAVNTNSSSKIYFVMTRSSNTSNNTYSDSEDYYYEETDTESKIWYDGPINGTVAAGGTSAASLSQEQMEQDPVAIVKAFRDTEFKDAPNGNKIGTVYAEAEVGIFDAKEVSGITWLKISKNSDWWVDADDFGKIDKFSDSE